MKKIYFLVTLFLLATSTLWADDCRFGDEVLKFGSKGSEVTRLQKFLIEQKLLKTNAFGTFGPATKLAVAKYQKANKISTTGNWDAATILVAKKSCSNTVVSTKDKVTGSNDYAVVEETLANYAVRADETLPRIIKFAGNNPRTYGMTEASFLEWEAINVDSCELFHVLSAKGGQLKRESLKKVSKSGIQSTKLTMTEVERSGYNVAIYQIDCYDNMNKKIIRDSLYFDGPFTWARRYMPNL